MIFKHAILLLLVAACRGVDVKPQFECPGLGNYPNPESCSSFYICGLDTDPVLIECPAGLLFDAKLQICNNAESVDCNIGGTSSTSPAPTTVPPTTMTTSSPTSTSTSRPTSTSQPQTTTGYEPDCPADGSILVENPTDCSSYFVCIDGNSMMLTCPDNLLFDIGKQECRPEQEVTCRVSTSPTPLTSTTTPSTGTTVPPGEGPQCPATGTIGLRNPADCNTFYLCVNGTSYFITCDIGWEFNVNSQLCEEPSTAGCSIPAPTTVPTESPPPVTTLPPPTDLPDCSNPGNNGVIFPNSQDCASYYQCSNGLVITQQCPAGLLFNPEVHVCDKPENVNCNKG